MTSDEVTTNKMPRKTKFLLDILVLDIFVTLGIFPCSHFLFVGIFSLVMLSLQTFRHFRQFEPRHFVAQNPLEA